MIDWWGVLYNSLWIVGLAGALAAFSLASYRARSSQETGMRQALNAPGFQVPFNAALALFCLGLLLSGGAWWERAIWGVLGLLFAGQAAWLWRAQRQEARRLAPEPAAETVEPPPSRASGRVGWLLLLAGALLLLAWAAWTGVQVLDHARSLQSHLQQVEHLTQGDVAALELDQLEVTGQHLSGMRADLEAIQRQVGPLLPLGRLFAWLPEHGGDAAAAAELLRLAVNVSAAGDRTFQALSPALDLVEGEAEDAGASPSLTEALVPVLVAAEPQLRAAQAELEAAEQARAGIDEERLSPRVAGLLARLDRYLPWFETALDGALLAPTLLGVEEPRTYLVVAQNNYELRATGGFISGVGELTVEDGQLGSLTFQDSYAVDNLEVPHDLTPPDFEHTLFGQLWFFRDANWDVDYPTSARRALQIYARDRGVEADGLIALDLTALKLLVGAVGPLRVEGVDQPVTGQNVLQVIVAQWSEGFVLRGEEQKEWWAQRKDFMGQIAGAAMDKLMSGEDVSLPRLALALKQALDEKHVLIYVRDFEAARLLHEQEWDGAAEAPLFSSDALIVVDSNVGFDKMDASVERSIHYRVDLTAEEGPRARLTLTYRNLSTKPLETCVQESRYGETYQDMMERCYWDYVRVYVPGDSELLAGPTIPLPEGSLLARFGPEPPSPPLSPTLSVDGWAVWTAFFALEPGAERELVFEYRLPAWVLDYEPGGLTRYHLDVQKQPGTGAVPFTLEVVLPPGAALLRAEPARPSGQPAMVTDLRIDREFEIVYREGEVTP